MSEYFVELYKCAIFKMLIVLLTVYKFKINN